MATAAMASFWVLATLLANAPGSGAGATPGTHCELDDIGSDHATSASCVRCHAHRQSHPYDIDYAHAAGRGDYAPLEKVVRAGVHLPNGEIRCVTCHDRRSPWRYKIALPPGATPSPSVQVTRDGSLERPVVPGPMVPGSEVTATPLCRVCHQF